MSKMIIVEGNSNDKDNVRTIMVKGEKGDQGDLNHNDIIDNLTSTAINKVLSARQGKVLKDLIDTNSDSIITNTTDISSLQTDLTSEITARANADATIQSQITGLASGSPIPVNSVSDMEDTTKIYVNTTDGNWYYYNGSSWAIGGVYQATVSDIVNTDELLESIYLNDNSSVVDILGYYVGKGIRTDNGKSFDNTKYIRTGRLEASSIGKLFVLDSDTMGIRYYNGNMSTEWSDDYLGFKTWTNLLYASIYPRIALVFKRADEADVSETDLANIKASLKIYRFTDRTLTEASVPADAKAVGDILNKNINNYFEKNENKSYVIDFNDYYDAVEEHTIQGNTYTSKGWFAGYLIANDTGFSNSYSYITTSYDISQIKGSIPKYIKVKINDLTDLTEPYIRIGWLDNTENVILHTSHDLEEAIVKIPSYPNLSTTSGGLYITIGRWENTPISLSDLEDRITEWVSDNVEITFYFDEVLNNREFTNNKFVTDSFLYNLTYDYALKIPKTYNAYNKEKTPLLILCHGLSSVITASKWGSSDDMLVLVNNFVNHGYAVMDVGQITIADWCNPNLIKKYVTAIEHICKNYNVEPKYIYAESMGSLIALTLQQEYNIKAIAIGGPRLDFEYSYDVSSNKSIINSNLGFTNGFDKYIASGWCKTLYELLDSDNNKVNVNQIPPTFYLYGDSDTQVSEATAKMEAIKRGGNIVETKTYSSNHHNICYLIAGTSLQDTLDWFDTWK